MPHLLFALTTSVLLFVLPLPHTVALRNMLLVILCILAICSGFRSRFTRLLQPDWRAPFLWVAALTLWLCIQAALWAVEPANSWGEILGQWLIPVLALIIGTQLGAASAARGGMPPANLLMLLLTPMLLQVLVTDGYKWLIYQRTGHWISYEFWLDMSRTNLSYVTNIVLAVLAADAVDRLAGQRRLLPFGAASWGCAFAAVLAATVLLNTRNGVMVAVALALAALVQLCWKGRRRLNRRWLQAGACSILIASALLGYINYQTDVRWRSFQETVPLALDTQHQRAWLNNTDYPRLANGQEVDISNYDRIAWAAEGIRMVIARPLGFGYSRDAFGAGLMARYGSGKGAHSHSGLLDLAISAGLPGALLWLGFLGSLMRLGWVRFAAFDNGYGLVLQFIVLDYGLRSLIDSNIRDHMLQQFMLLAGVALALSLQTVPPKGGQTP